MAAVIKIVVPEVLRRQRKRHFHNGFLPAADINKNERRRFILRRPLLFLPVRERKTYGLNPHALKEQSPAFAGEDQIIWGLSYAREGGELHFEARGFSPVFPFPE